MGFPHCWFIPQSYSPQLSASYPLRLGLPEHTAQPGLELTTPPKPTWNLRYSCLSAGTTGMQYLLDSFVREYKRACAYTWRPDLGCHSSGAVHPMETGSLTGAWSLPSRTGWLTSKSWEPPVSPPQHWIYKCALLSLASVHGCCGLNRVPEFTRQAF